MNETHTELLLEQLRRDMRKMEEQVDKMYHALMGNELLADGGIIGIVKQLKQENEELERRMTNLERKNAKLEIYQKIVWTSLGSVGATVFAYILQLIFTNKK